VWNGVAFTGVAIAATLLFSSTAQGSLLGLFDDEPELYDEPVVEPGNSQTMELLVSARNLDPTPSRGGGDVVLADDQALVAEATPYSNISHDQVAPATPDQISLYLVEEGDTLSQVAEMFNVSVNTIVWANELGSDKDIHPGQTLLILPVSGLQHTIAKGDTLKSIAKEYSGGAEDIDGLIEEILEFNDMQSGDELVVGETLTIPGGEMEIEMEETATYASAPASAPSAAGYFIHPLPGSVKTQGLHGYNGVDFGAGIGTPIRAAAGGRVISSRVGGWNGGYGNYVVIDHPNGTQTLYAHNSSNAVWQGQSVVQGQVIGYVGNTGRSTGPHLHFEVRGARNPF
jgi:LysM repeat protein